MKRRATLIGIIFLFSSLSHAFHFEHNTPIQSELIADDEIKEKWDKALGSFQFEILNDRPERSLIQIDISIIEDIEANRHETEIVYLAYNDFMQIKILPKSVIEQEFEKLTLRVFVDQFTNA